MLEYGTAQTALKYEALVDEYGHVNLQVPLTTGTRILVFIIPETPESDDFVRASESSLAFWDNPLDDEDWNNA